MKKLVDQPRLTIILNKAILFKMLIAIKILNNFFNEKLSRDLPKNTADTFFSQL